MATSGRKGVSDELSYAITTENHLNASEGLIETIKNMGAFEDDAGLKQRGELVEFIQSIVETWVTQLAKKQGLEEKSFGAKVFPFGSHLLKVVNKDSDLDVVVVVPSFVARAEFFTSFVDLLHLKSGPDLSKCRLVTGARVPIIEIYLKNYEVDLCIARIQSSYLPSDLDLDRDTILRDMDLVDVWSINGTRETSRILQLVPNVCIFQETYKAVKSWAKVQHIYSAAHGYPGGIAWAIMVARVCQLYPDSPTTTLVQKFFKILLQWEWPMPVLLTTLTKKDPYKFKPWNSKVNPADVHHIMPVITPVYPEKNCAFTVTRSGLQVVINCLQRASYIMEQIFENHALWSDLFIPIDFFSMYKHYLMLTATTCGDQEQLDWSGLIQARSRIFVEALEKQPSLALIHAYSKPFHNQQETRWFWGLKFSEAKGIKLNLTDDLHSFQEHLIGLAKERDLYKSNMALQVFHIKRKDLKLYLPAEEKR